MICLEWHLQRTRLEYSQQIWFDMILSFSESNITGSFRSPLFDKNGFTVGQKSLDLGPPAHLSEK